MNVEELLITTSRHQYQNSACVWDPTTGSALHTYKNGGVIAPKTLNFICNDYLLTTEENKPITHIWPLNSQEPDKKMTSILSEKVTAMSLSPNNEYLAAGIGVKLYIWQLSSGKLLTIQKKHYQNISCVKFSTDGSCILVAGQDGMLVVYKLVALISLHSNLASESEGQIEPLYTKNDHTLPISDLHVGNFGSEARFITASLDNTCKLYSLKTGTLLLNLVFEEALTSVIFDSPCWNLYVGLDSGKIQQFILKSPPRNINHHISNELMFQGHTKRVTCLDLSLFSGILVSGSEDNFVFLWDITSRQILRRIEHKGAVTNVRCLLKHENFFVQNLRIGCIVRNLDRELIHEENFTCGKIQNWDIQESDDEDLKEENLGRVKDLLNENKKLKATNHALYEVAVNIARKKHNI